jgi:hypothetical protein
MSNGFYDLASKLQEDGAAGSTAGSGGSTGGATTMNMISYLPTQVGVVRSVLSGLGKKKKKWNLEILEGDTDRTVCFEDALKIVVPNEHWDNFQEIFDGQIDSSSCFTLPSFIMDNKSLEDAVDLEGRRVDIHLALESALDCPEIRCAQQVYSKWISRFKPDKDLTSEKVMFPLHTLKDGVEKVYQKLVESCSDDRGQLEMLSESLSEPDSFLILQKTLQRLTEEGQSGGLFVYFQPGGRMEYQKPQWYTTTLEDLILLKTSMTGGGEVPGLNASSFWFNSLDYYQEAISRLTKGLSYGGWDGGGDGMIGIARTRNRAKLAALEVPSKEREEVEKTEDIESLEQQWAEPPSLDVPNESKYKNIGHTILAGARIHSTLDGVGVIFEAQVGFDKNLYFSVLVEDAEIADRLQESLTGARRVGNVFFVRSGHFACQANVQNLLVEAIQDLKGGD